VPLGQLAFLDEATSALDLATEKRCLQSLKASGTTLVSTGHRETLEPFHGTIIDIGLAFGQEESEIA
jgi:vitamin B12/bleomycin/antimicrobial peptide transport system ATP-binding/permease protein